MLNDIVNGVMELADEYHWNCRQSDEGYGSRDPDGTRQALLEGVKAICADALRYRYLRNRVPADVLGNAGPTNGCWIDMDGERGPDGTMPLILLTGDDADKAIDAALSPNVLVSRQGGADE